MQTKAPKNKFGRFLNVLESWLRSSKYTFIFSRSNASNTICDNIEIAFHRYGLIKPQKPTARLTAFMSDSDSDDEQPAKKKVEIGPGESQKRQARIVQEKALEEDPTIFQYDELYDSMTATREDAKKAKTTEVKKSKYIERLLVTADQRKKEYERRIERQVQRDRAAEGDMYKDKETFVTATYRAKLEELKKAEEIERREEYLEAIGDVTKQRDLGGFYRHLYEQKMGAPDAGKSTTTASTDGAASEEKKTDGDGGSKKKQRSYRRHDSSMENEDEERKSSGTTTEEGDEPVSKKVHLQSNIDADSDFSIDDSDSEDDDKVKNEAKNESEKTEQNSTVAEADSRETSKPPADAPHANGAETDHVFLKPEAPNAISAGVKPDVTDEEPEPVPPKPKIDVWKKRTVGEVFDAALQRYYERKQLRCQ